MTIIKAFLGILAILVTTVLFGCSGSPSSLPIPSLVSISVSSPVNSVQAGGTVQLSATVSNTSNNSVVWTVEGVPGGNSLFGTISASGLYTAPSVPPNPPLVTITGAAMANTSVFQSTSLTITPAPAPVTVTVSPKTATVQVGSQQSFTATVSNSSNTSVTWQVAGVQGGNATVGAISSSGVYTAPAAVPTPSTVTVTAVSNADPTKSDSATVTISAAPPVVVTVTPSNVDLQVGVGSTFQFNATVMNTNNTAVTWQVNGVTGGDTTVGTITSSGLYSAPTAVPQNTAIVTVTAVSVADPTAFGNATVTLFTGPPPILVSITPTNPTANVGTQVPFSANVQNASDTSVTWYVNSIQGGNPTFGQIAPPLTTGNPNDAVYTAPPVVPNPSTVTVTAVANADGKTSASTTLTIGSAVVVTVTPTPPTTSVFLGQSWQFTANVSNSPNQNVLWSLSGLSCIGTGCGMITTSGLYIAPLTLPTPNSNVTITATSVADPTKSGPYTVAITSVPTPTVTITAVGPALTAGGSQVFTATVSYDPLMQGVTWGLTCVADGDDNDGDCSGDNPPGDSDGDTDFWLTNITVSPNSVTVNAGVDATALGHGAVVTLTATSVAQSTSGVHGQTMLTITVP